MCSGSPIAFLGVLEDLTIASQRFKLSLETSHSHLQNRAPHDRIVKSQKSKKSIAECGREALALGGSIAYVTPPKSVPKNERSKTVYIREGVVECGGQPCRRKPPLWKHDKCQKRDTPTPHPPENRRKELHSPSRARARLKKPRHRHQGVYRECL